MRHALSAIAVFAALPGAALSVAPTARAQEIQFPLTNLPIITLDPDAPAPVIAVDDIYQSAPTLVLRGRASREGGDDCQPELVDEASHAAFLVLSGRQRSNVVMALCTDDYPGGAYAAELATPHVPPFIVMDVDDIAQDMHDWPSLTEQQRGWWIDYVQDHEVAHTHFRAQPFRAAVAGTQRRWSYEELAPDLTAVCLAHADVLSPARGPWLEQRLLNYRSLHADSTTHGVFGDLLLVSLSDFAQQCRTLGQTLTADELRPAAARLALSRTLGLANPPRAQVAVAP